MKEKEREREGVREIEGTEQKTMHGHNEKVVVLQVNERHLRRNQPCQHLVSDFQPLKM
jgi:RNA polymerase-interacting CarD/CdnL/TRCF family regulator